ncbi:hypothetical protein [Bordetella petrii]|uniref:hypothetical protein n=1 Tax=Bordetella petrii TaxID=94624 RepID=UPI001A95BF5A|nr:hypothetical protein [Bordetella petrii]MBO1112946.1 hypothetical protein [Bordetella petrii]
MNQLVVNNLWGSMKQEQSAMHGAGRPDVALVAQTWDASGLNRAERNLTIV